MNPTCSTCKHAYWNWPKDVNPHDDGQCRKNAPQTPHIVALAGQNHIQASEFMTYWPAIKGASWCGDHKPKESDDK